VTNTTMRPSAGDAGPLGTFGNKLQPRPKPNRPGAQAALGIAAGERPIASIKIGARHRHDLGDIDSLAASPGGEP
jgi:hypothetical protein